VAGFYSLAAGAVAHELAAGKLRRNMPDPIPVLVLGRLGVDLGFQGRGLGSALLRDAILRSLQAAEIAGIRALLVQAKNESARAFYLRSGFFESPIDPMILMILLKDAAKAL
jgi:GNAT superfamily N-acetyltransferase